jgi:hypothetical protein
MKPQMKRRKISSQGTKLKKNNTKKTGGRIERENKKMHFVKVLS